MQKHAWHYIWWNSVDSPAHVWSCLQGNACPAHLNKEGVLVSFQVRKTGRSWLVVLLGLRFSWVLCPNGFTWTRLLETGQFPKSIRFKIGVHLKSWGFFSQNISFLCNKVAVLLQYFSIHTVKTYSQYNRYLLELENIYLFIHAWLKSDYPFLPGQ